MEQSETETNELRALMEMARVAQETGAAEDMEHLDGPAAAFNSIRIADLVSSYYRLENLRNPILDWGCGYGQVTWLLQRRGLPVVACDVQIRAARSLIPELDRVPVDLCTDSIRLPYGPASFGAVLSVGVLEHVADFDGSLAEVHRVLQPGGLFFIFMLPNRFSWAERIHEWRGISVHPYKFTFERISQMLRTDRFTVEKRWRRNFLPRNLTGFSHKVKMLYGRFYREIEVLDGLLANCPPTSLFSGVVELIARKM